MEQDTYDHIVSVNDHMIDSDEETDDDGCELPDQCLMDDSDEPVPEEVDEPTVKPTNLKKGIVDAQGKTYEDYLSEMGVETNNPQGHYVNNKELYEHMKKYCAERDKALAEGKPKPQIDNYIATAIMKIATHLSFRPNFIGYSWRQDMVSDAIINCITYIDSFDPTKSQNPFAYLTQVCWSAFIWRLKSERRESVKKGRVMMMSNVTDTMQLDSDEAGDVVINNQGNIHHYMELAQEEEDKQRKLKEEKRIERDARKEAMRQKTSLEEFFA